MPDRPSEGPISGNRDYPGIVQLSYGSIESSTLASRKVALVVLNAHFGWVRSTVCHVGFRPTNVHARGFDPTSHEHPTNRQTDAPKHRAG
jgi:hypothetical protein